MQSYDYERPPPPPEPTSAQTPGATFQKALDKFVPPEGLKIPTGMEVVRIYCYRTHLCFAVLFNV